MEPFIKWVYPHVSSPFKSMFMLLCLLPLWPFFGSVGGRLQLQKSSHPSYCSTYVPWAVRLSSQYGGSYCYWASFCINHVAHRHFRTEKEARKTTSAMRQKKLTLEKATSSLTIWPSSLLLLSSSPTTRVEKNEVGHNQNFFSGLPPKNESGEVSLYSPFETLHAWNNFLVKNLISSRAND